MFLTAPFMRVFCCDSGSGSGQTESLVVTVFGALWYILYHVLVAALTAVQSVWPSPSPNASAAPAPARGAGAEAVQPTQMQLLR